MTYLRPARLVGSFLGAGAIAVGCSSSASSKPGDGVQSTLGSVGECDLSAPCTPAASTCLIKSAGPCGGDERLVCGADGAYSLDGFPCGPADCSEESDGPTSCKESCTCEDGGTVCSGTCSADGPVALCSGGGCVLTMTSRQGVVTAIATDEAYVYWSDGMNQAVMKMPANGGTPTILASGESSASAGASPSPETSLAGIAVDATNVYWSDVVGDVGGSILTMSKQGGAKTTLASGQHNVNAVAVDAVNVYWVGSEVVAQVPVGGGSVTTLATGRLNPYGIAVRDGVVFFTGTGAGSAVMTVPAGGGSVTTLATGQIDPYGLTTDAVNVYWTDAGKILKAPLSGGASTTLFSSPDGALSVATDGVAVYWTDNAQDGVVRRMSVDGSGVTTVASGQRSPLPVALDATGVYFGTGANGMGALMKVTPR